MPNSARLFRLNLQSSSPKLRSREPTSRSKRDKKRLLSSRKLRKFLDRSKRRPCHLPRSPRSTELSSKSKSPLVSPRKLRRESLLSRPRLRPRESPLRRSASKPPTLRSRLPMFKSKLSKLRTSLFKRLELRKRLALRLARKPTPSPQKLRKNSPLSSRRRRLTSRRKNPRSPPRLRLSLQRLLTWNQPSNPPPRPSLRPRPRSTPLLQL